MTESNTAAPASGPNVIPLPTDRLWTVHEAAAYLRRSTSWVYKAAERGDLPRARGMGWGLRFVPAEIEAFARGTLKSAAVVPISRTVGGR